MSLTRFIENIWVIGIFAVAVLLLIIMYCFQKNQKKEDEKPVLETPAFVRTNSSEISELGINKVTLEAHLRYPDKPIEPIEPTRFITTLTIPISESGYPSIPPPDYASALFDPDHPDQILH